MRTPTLVLATILAMAIVGDSANMEKMLQQLGFPEDKEPADGASINPKNKAHEKGKGFTQALGQVNAVTQSSKTPKQKGKESKYDITMILADPTKVGIPVNAITRASHKVEAEGKQDIQDIVTHPTSEAQGVTQGKEVTSRPTPVPNPVTTITPAIEATHGGVKPSLGPTQGLNPANAITSATAGVGQEGQSTPFILGTPGRTRNGTQEKAKRRKPPSGLVQPMAHSSQKSKPKGTVEPPVTKNYDWYDWYNYEDAGSGENDVNVIGDYSNEERGLDETIDDTFLVRDVKQETEDYNYGDMDSDSDYEDGSADTNIYSWAEGEATYVEDSAENPTNNVLRGILSRADKRQLPMPKRGVLQLAAKNIGKKVLNKIGNRIADSVGINYQEKIESGLKDYLGKTFDDEYKDLLKDTSGMAAGLNREVKEADIQLVPKPGASMGNMFAPPGWEIRHKYKYKDDSDKNKAKDSSSGQVAAYSYPAGLGPVLTNGCFGTGYKNGDPCYKAKIPRTGCPNMIDGATYLGVGFDGRGVYSAESRKKSIIQRSCSNLQTYGENEVPDSMAVHGIYDTDVESHTFSSMEDYRKYLEEKSAVTSAKAMFQEEISKASGYDAYGIFGLGGSGGSGQSKQNSTSRQSTKFGASSSASAQMNENQARTFMAMLEMNIFRYEIFMDDVKPEQLNVGFLRDFISLPESYFSPGAEIIFQNFYLRWGTHYIKSAKFGGQLKIIKTKKATMGLTMSEFATRAEDDWKKTLNTFSAQASQTKSSSWLHDHEWKTENSNANGVAAAKSNSESDRKLEKEASSQKYSNEMLVVQGGDQHIAAAITEMYTSALTTELKDWLDSIDTYPKPFSFVLRLVSDLLNIPFDSLFPEGEVDYGCFGAKTLNTEKGTGRKYYTQKASNSEFDDMAPSNSSEATMIAEIRYCDFTNREDFEDSMAKKRLALERAVTVYLEEGRLLSSDFLLPAGEAGCETAMLAYLQGSKSGVPTWKEMIGGKEFTVIFDMPYNIPGIIKAQDVLQLKFISNMWFSTRLGSAPHLYDGYKNGGSNDVKGKKVSVQGLVMTYDEGTGIFTVTDEDFKTSGAILPGLPYWIKGRGIARAEYKKLLNHLGQKTDTMGDVPCGIQWSNAHRLDPTDGGKCIHFTAASEGDIFVVFASIPQNHETWIYVQISPEGVALYKALRLQTTQLNENAGGLGSANLYQSYFVCVTEDVKEKTTVIQYGKTPDNEERPHVWLGFTIHKLAHLRYYSFGNGASPAKVMGLSLLDKPAKDFVACRGGTEIVDGVCQQKCHPECKGCRTSGSDSPTDCIACKHLKILRDEEIGSFECVTQCPPHMEEVTATKTCTCIKRLEEPGPDGVVECLTECPLTHFDDNNVCRKCSSFCRDTVAMGRWVCSGPTSNDCDTCKYQHEGICVEGCRPGHIAVKTGGNGAFTCQKCQPGHECRLGDEREDICPAGTASNDNRTMCVPCAAGEFSSAPGAASCQKCPAGKYSTGGRSTSCLDCPAGKYNSAAGSRGCTTCPAGKYSSRAGSESCADCPVGTYSNTKGSTSCKTCPKGKYSSKVKSTSCIDCIAGQYSDLAGETSCKVCPAGKYSSNVGSTSCMDCPAGQYSDVEGAMICKACPAGKYSTETGSKICMGCPAGQYTDTVGSTGCKACPAGKYSNRVGSLACVDCTAGQYIDTEGSTSCKACTAGKYSNSVASTSCKACPAGQYNNGVGARGCRACPSGRYSGAGARSCRTCPRGLSSRQGSSRCACPSGYAMSRGSCFKVYRNAKNYDGARRVCSSDRGLLAMPKSSAVNTFIYGLARKDNRRRDYFIGLGDARSEGIWRFADNTLLGRYQRWNPKEPNNYRGGEDCVVLRYNGRWNDQNCRRAFPFICQIN